MIRTCEQLPVLLQCNREHKYITTQKTCCLIKTDRIRSKARMRSHICRRVARGGCETVRSGMSTTTASCFMLLLDAVHAWLVLLGDGQPLKIYLVITLHKQYRHSCSNFHITIIFLCHGVPCASNRNAAWYAAGAGAVNRMFGDITPKTIIHPTIHPTDCADNLASPACACGYIRAHNNVIDPNHHQPHQAAASVRAATAPHTYRN